MNDIFLAIKKNIIKLITYMSLNLENLINENSTRIIGQIALHRWVEAWRPVEGNEKNYITLFQQIRHEKNDHLIITSITSLLII